MIELRLVVWKEGELRGLATIETGSEDDAGIGAFAWHRTVISASPSSEPDHGMDLPKESEPVLATDEVAEVLLLEAEEFDAGGGGGGCMRAIAVALSGGGGGMLGKAISVPDARVAVLFIALAYRRWAREGPLAAFIPVADAGGSLSSVAGGALT